MKFNFPFSDWSDEGGIVDIDTILDKLGLETN
jgi:hypothetical protein